MYLDEHNYYFVINKKYGTKYTEQIIQYSYYNSSDPTKEILPPSIEKNSKSMLNKIQQYNESMRNINSSQRIIPTNINKYSKDNNIDSIWYEFKKHNLDYFVSIRELDSKIYLKIILNKKEINSQIIDIVKKIYY